MKNPFRDKFELSKKIGSWGIWFSRIAFILSIFSVIFENDFWVIALGILAVLMFLTDIVKGQILSMANRQRIDDLIDNSFEKNFGESRSEGYYTNETTTCGIERLAVNIFESCFYSKRILEDVRCKTWIWAIGMTILIIVIACMGLQTILCIIFQASFPILLLINAVQSEMLISKLSDIESDYRKIYNNSNDNCRMAGLMSCVLKYENAMATYKALLSESSYKKLNKKLNEEWNSLKKKYNLE